MSSSIPVTVTTLVNLTQLSRRQVKYATRGIPPDMLVGPTPAWSADRLDELLAAIRATSRRRPREKVTA